MPVLLQAQTTISCNYSARGNCWRVCGLAFDIDHPLTSRLVPIKKGKKTSFIASLRQKVPPLKRRVQKSQ